MQRLINSSTPGAVERDLSIRILTERAVLTRSLCRELLESDGNFSDRRTSTALGHLLRWVAITFPESVRAEPHPSDGLDKMTVPDACLELFQEIRDGAQVGEALFMLFTADNSFQADGDRKIIRQRLDEYWANHPSPAAAPGLYSS